MTSDRAKPVAPFNPADGTLLAGIDHAIDFARDPRTLFDNTRTAIAMLLDRDEDRELREKMVSTVARLFQAAAGNAATSNIVHLRQVSKKAVRIVATERAKRAHPATTAATTPAPALAATTAEVTRPTTIVEVPPPPPSASGDFATLFPDALTWKMRQALSFFQRHNPDIRRALPRPFLLSPDFDARLGAVIRDRIAPAMLRSGRALTMLETTRDWSTATTADFWVHLDEDPRRKEIVCSGWDTAWAAYRQQRTLRKDKETGEVREVLLASPALKELREALSPSAPDAYDIPPVRNQDIDLLASLLFEFDRDVLEGAWIKLRQVYEQEMDPRWYQDKARTGALRDSLLDVFTALPDRIGEFVAILCYYTFPHINLHFLERFTFNKGRNDDERARKIPYLMRFLSHPEVPDLRRQELDRDRERQMSAKPNRP